MKTRFLILAGTAITSAGLLGATSLQSAALAHGAHTAPNSGSTSTTLDACGYFGGKQTPSTNSQFTDATGTTHYSDRGTWTGVTNISTGTAVASLGSVTGDYSENYTVDAVGNLKGVEQFQSNSGAVEQNYSYDTVTNAWTVRVSANRALTFLSSDTNGHCYTGAYPRP